MKKIISIIVLVSLLMMSAATVAAAPPAQGGDEVADEEGQAYVVEPSDWLSRIAERFLGDADAFQVIIDATNKKAAEDESFEIIVDPDLISVGQKLWIPVTEALSSFPAVAPQESGLVGTYQSLIDVATDSDKSFVLRLHDDNTASLTTNFGVAPDEAADTIETGSWRLNNDGTVTVVLSGVARGELYKQPDVLTFEVQDDILSAIDFDLNNRGLSGIEGLTLQKSVETTAQPGFEGTYIRMLPTIEGPDREVMLDLNADNSALRITRSIGGGDPVVEVGTWETNPDGTATVTIVGELGEPLYEQPDIITFALVDGNLNAVEFDINAHGPEGMEFARQ